MTEKYNRNGEWKPLISQGPTDALLREILRSTDDDRLQGCLFYLRVTGCRVIEFAAKTRIRFEADQVELMNGVHLLRVEDSDAEAANLLVYDGWIGLDDDSIEAARSGLEEISRTMNLLAFAMRQEVTWRPKYLIRSHQRGIGQVGDADLELMNHVLGVRFDSPAQRFIDAALDWYARGERSASPFNRYLGYWVALEALAIALHDGRLGAMPAFPIDRQGQEARERSRDECLTEYVERFLESRDHELISRAYSECIRSLRRRARQGLESVFGGNSPEVRAIFDDPADGFTLEGIRNQIAHGEFVEWNFEHEGVVRRRVDPLASITRRLILRILMQARPGEALPDWPRALALHAEMRDPRNILVASDERTLPTTDWRIRAAWVE